MDKKTPKNGFFLIRFRADHLSFGARQRCRAGNRPGNFRKEQKDAGGFHMAGPGQADSFDLSFAQVVRIMPKTGEKE